MSNFARTFGEINKDMTQECGGKASHLGELTGIGFNVPPGFCVISAAFSYHIEKNAIKDTILELAGAIDYEDIDDTMKKTSEIRSLIEEANIPPDLESDILEAYQGLGTEGEKAPLVAVRSSVAVRDSAISSFPGLMDTYHYVKGKEDVIICVKRCWASVWTDRATVARKTKGIEHTRAIIAPIVQRMINSDLAGILFTANPVTSNREEMMIEANWGIGESVVSGKTQPDHFVLEKSTFKIKNSVIAKKARMIAQGKGGGREWFDVDPAKADIPTLTDEKIAELGKAGLAIEKHYGYPQDIEWAYEGGRLYVLQTRRITTLKD
jgi:pyruvate,water dikinase